MLKAERRQQKRIKKLAKQQRKSNIKSLLVNIEAGLRRHLS